MFFIALIVRLTMFVVKVFIHFHTYHSKPIKHIRLKPIKHIRAECQKLGFGNALLTFNAFAAHLTDDVESQLLEAKTDTLAIPGGCTQSANAWMFV